MIRIFGKRKKAAYENDLKQQNQQSSQMLMAALNKPPSALESAKEKEQTDWLTQTNSPNFDVTKTTGMAPYMNLYNRAKTNNMASDTPEPTGASWGGAANTGLREALSAQGSRSREQEAAGGLEQAFGAKNAAMRGDTMPFLAMQQQKNMGLWDVLNNRSLNMSSMYGRSITTPSLFQQYLMAGMKSAGDMTRGAGGAGP